MSIKSHQKRGFELAGKEPSTDALPIALDELGRVSNVVLRLNRTSITGMFWKEYIQGYIHFVNLVSDRNKSSGSTAIRILLCGIGISVYENRTEEDTAR